MTILSLSGSGVAPAPSPAEQAPRNAEVAHVPEPVQATTSAAPQTGPSLEQIQQATKQVQEMVQSKASNLTFSVDQGSGKTIVKLMDTQTGEILRQIPSEEMIVLSQAIDKMQGLLIRQKA